MKKKNKAHLFTIWTICKNLNNNMKINLGIDKFDEIVQLQVREEIIKHYMKEKHLSMEMES